MHSILPLLACLLSPSADRLDLLVTRDSDGRAVPIRSRDDWHQRREQILAAMQLVLGPLPPDSRRVPLDLRIDHEETLPAVVRRRVSFAVEKGDRLTAYLLLPRNHRGRGPAMLCLHQTTTIGKAEPAGLGGKPNLHYALELARRGYVTLAPDYPNFGGYRFDPYAHGYASASMKGVWNHRRAVDLLCSLPEVDPDRIGVIGHSLGGHNALFVAAFEPRLRLVVSSCGFNSFHRYRKGHLADWSHQGYMPRIATVYGNSASKMPFDFTEVLAALAPRAVFVNAPLKDDDFEVDGVRDCIRAAMPVFRLLGAGDRLEVVYPDAGHDFPPAVRSRTYDFIDRHLGKRLAVPPAPSRKSR